MNQDKLAKLQSQVRIGGKGTPRRKMKKTHKPAGADDKKVQAAMKKLSVQPVGPIEEVNMFQADGHVLNFKAPKVMASLNSNMFTIGGHGAEKELTELMPGILSQMGPEALNSLRQIAESYQAAAAAAGGPKDGEDDDDVPELVENFEEAAAVAEKSA